MPMMPEGVLLSLASATTSFIKSAIVVYAAGTLLVHVKPVVTSAGHVTVGGVMSLSNTNNCTHIEELPHASVIVYVRVIVRSAATAEQKFN
jgi:hypothetical protein